MRDALGSLARPLSDADLERKVRGCVAAGGSGCDAGRLIDAAWGVDEAATLEPLLAALRPPA